MNLNKAFIIGNLTRDPELRTLPSGAAVASFGIATNRNWTNQSGEKQQDTQFHNIVSFGKQAEIAHQYLKKGGLICIEGRIQTRSWDAPDGSKRYRTEIITERLQMGPRKAPTVARGNDGVPSSPDQSVGTPPQADAGKETLDTIEYPEENNDGDNVPF